MLRNKEPELAENIDNSFEWFDLVFYRVIFVFGSRHLILVRTRREFTAATTIEAFLQAVRNILDAPSLELWNGANI